MKIVIALDSFKGTMTAAEACAIVRDAILAVSPGYDIVLKPMADGGEGTAEALVVARGGERITADVMGPLPDRQVSASFAWFASEREAVVEMAAASGLPLLRISERNPMVTTTYGTGQLIRRAMEKGAKRVLLAVGGSATVDGGIGAAMALGWQFRNGAGEPIELGGGHLAEIVEIEPPDMSEWPVVEVLCDVDSPLCGPEGAARVYGPQKGATPEMVEKLEKGLEHLASSVQETLDRNIRDLPGGGAAGGLAAGAAAFMAGKLVPGGETVMAASELKEALADADWVITGEGKFDEQSLRGKVVSGVTKLAGETGTSVAVLAGCVKLHPETRLPEVIKVVKGTQKEGMPLEAALRQAKEDLYDIAKVLAENDLR